MIKYIFKNSNIILPKNNVIVKGNLTQNLCINCKFFKSDSIKKYGKCELFPIIIENKYYLVDGKIDQINDYEYCSVARKYQDMCGKEGKLYENI